MATPNSGIRVVYFGNERLVSGLAHTDAPILERLIADGYDVACVVSHHTGGTSRSARPLEVARVAERHGIPVLTPARIGDVADELRRIGADVAVLVAFGQIIPQSVIDIFPHGIINVHPSLLPAYRGPTPIETAIMNGDRDTGVSIMKLVAAMDAGPVYVQETLPIAATDTKFDVYKKVIHVSAGLLSGLLPGIVDGQVEPRDQDESGATYSRLLTKSDGILDPSIQTATQAARNVRAHVGYPKSKLKIGGHMITVTAAHAAENAEKGLRVAFADGTHLSIDELIAPNGKKMSGDNFLRGYTV